MSACSADPVASGDDLLEPSTVPAAEEPEPTTIAPTLESAAPDGTLAGRIAVGGNAGLQLLEPSGEPAAVVSSGAVAVSQPTWSRSGDRVVATIAAGGAGFQTLVVADTGDDSVSTPVRRPYFFYSWSTDGSYIAALGPGLIGTSLDILDADGVPVSDVALDSGSLYLAWEPGGDDLLVHDVRAGEVTVSRRPLRTGTIVTDELLAEMTGVRGDVIDFDDELYGYAVDAMPEIRISRIRDMAALLKELGASANYYGAAIYLRGIVMRLCGHSFRGFLEAKNLRSEVHQLNAEIVKVLDCPFADRRPTRPPESEPNPAGHCD